MNKFGWLMAYILLFMFSPVLSGYCLQVLWGWFLVPAFGFPAVSLPTAIGITIIISFLCKQIEIKKNDPSPQSDKFANAVFIAIAKPGITLLIGWIVTLFI